MKHIVIVPKESTKLSNNKTAKEPEVKVKKMAEENELAEEIGFSITDPSTPDFYANMTHVTVSRSDITIFYGRHIEEIGSNATKTLPLARVTITHDHFIRMVDYWKIFQDFLITSYGDEHPSLTAVRDKYPERFKEAIALLAERG